MIISSFAKHLLRKVYIRETSADTDLEKRAPLTRTGHSVQPEAWAVVKPLGGILQDQELRLFFPVASHKLLGISYEYLMMRFSPKMPSFTATRLCCLDH